MKLAKHIFETLLVTSILLCEDLEIKNVITVYKTILMSFIYLQIHYVSN
jgi:hypothetical protein